ncbi:hypothetical protein [Rhizobium phaseoli]|uniref:Uncharacterized protein n=1 Tax=Rhizobium phaseoli TaxID=396 RepID=A0ABM6C8T9_9HYPH|nr:hypothetical protein [Rhizobium phaseoli]ANL84628.1 hypothetical protein AMC81_CH01847 [Rhizobium phaseoli]ANL91135.1 hypothetical protein AMC80_CH01847 [Rhizobium phaseoli]
MKQLPEPRFESACFGAMRWFVGSIPFTSKQDCENAIRLARQYAYEVREELASEIADKINEVFR